MTAMLTDDTLYGLNPTPIRPDLSLKQQPRPSVAERITGPIGKAAVAIAAAVVIIALMVSVGSARDAASAARTDAAGARAETATAKATLTDTTAKLIGETNARAAATAQVAFKDRQLAEDRAVALRAQTCITTHFEVESVMIGGSHSAIMAAISRLSVCQGIGPALRAVGGGTV